MPKPMTRADALAIVAAVDAAIAAGHPYPAPKDGKGGALHVAALALGTNRNTLGARLTSARERFGLTPTPAPAVVKAPAFTIPAGVDACEEDAEAIIDRLSAKHARRVAAHRELIPVDVSMDGPIALAIVGDPHIDDDGCAWGELKRDVDTIAESEGMLAVSVGDYRNNWVGRLAKLYAHQDVTLAQTLKLIEWLFGRLPWLALVQGNHDAWNTDGGDPVALIHRLAGQPGLYGEPAYRMELRLPSGAKARVHIRHDFPGKSQFNPAHGPMRQTLYDARDHIIACGDRHHAGYQPVWHNDPAPILCHAMRVASYKDFDAFAKEKGYKREDWSRTMVAIIDPRYAHDPVEFITMRFSVAAGARELARRRAEWREETEAANDNDAAHRAAFDADFQHTNLAAAARAIEAAKANRKRRLK